VKARLERIHLVMYYWLGNFVLPDFYPFS